MVAATARAEILGQPLPRTTTKPVRRGSTSPSLVSERDHECATYYDDAVHYDEIWGKDNIHIGYYPHLTDRTAPELDFQAAAVQITNRLIELGDISHESRVLDLGCGKGIACAQIAEMTGAQCTGLDLSPANIDRANDLAVSRPELQLDFLEGSFISLPASLHGKYTHIISQEAFSHVHAELPTIFVSIQASAVACDTN